VYGRIVWNTDGRIFHKGALDDVPKFGDDRSKFRHTLSDVCCENWRKTRHEGLNLALRSEWNNQCC